MIRVFHDDEINTFFLREGYAVLDLLTPDEIDRLRGFYDEFGGTDGLIVNFTIDSKNMEYRKNLHDALASVLRGPTERNLAGFRMFGPNFVTKPPGAGHLDLHLDNTIVDEEKSISVNTWCILHDVNEENGCLTVVPQSHRWTTQKRAFGDMLNYSPFRNVIKALEEHYETPVPLKAGQAIVYHSRTIHGSMPNRTDKVRIATLSGARPVGGELIFHHRHSPTSVETFRASDEFYWNDNFVFNRPERAEPLGFVDIIEEDPLTETELHSLVEQRSKHPEMGLF
ncbi:phytanoyl-CoA dioxygenase family protein [bacterium]|nr:phytanoyl-CoA dioxygenase family protein [bacterium]